MFNEYFGLIPFITVAEGTDWEGTQQMQGNRTPNSLSPFSLFFFHQDFIVCLLVFFYDVYFKVINRGVKEHGGGGCQNSPILAFIARGEDKTSVETHAIEFFFFSLEVEK